MALEVAKGTRLTEPELFYFGLPPRPGGTPPQPRQHGSGLGKVTGVSIPLAHAPTRPLRAVEELGLVRFPRGDGPLLALHFEAVGGAGGAADLRPALPLVLRW